MPTYEVVERHQVRVGARSDVAFRAACDLDLQRSTLIAAIFKAREKVLRSAPDSAKRPRALVPWAETLGWGMLANVPGHEIVMGAATRPWDANVVFRVVPPEQFALFNEPNYVKIVWTLRVDPVSDDASVARTETRAVATDLMARHRFRCYWALFSPGISLIRREALRLVKADAERRTLGESLASTDRFDLASEGDLDPQR
jgi:hypothetical protein